MEKKYQELFDELLSLKRKYETSIEGRKDIIKSIRNQIYKIRKETSIFNPELNELEQYYSYRDYYINDYKFVMNLLVKLANNNEERYSINEVKVVDYFPIGDENKKLYSEVIFITDDMAMQKFDSQVYYFDGFVKKATDLINQGHSMIMITKNLFESRVKPKQNQVKCDQVFDIRNGGIFGNITCYISSPFLLESINKLVEYINVNGPDFNNINEDELLSLLNNSNIYKKK